MSLAAVSLRGKIWWDRLVGAFLGRDGLFLLIARILHAGNGFILSVILIREFGLAAVGTYTIAVVAVVALSLLCGSGLNYSLPREPLATEEKNTVALGWALLMIPVTPLAAIPFGLLMAHHPREWLEISLFACGGYFFGQSSLLNTLLVLQKRTRWAIAPPLANTAGLLVGMLLSRAIAQFAVILLISRACGSLWLFAGMKYQRMRASAIWHYCMNGLRYTSMDFLAMLSDQTSPLIIASMVSRADLGVFGLCAQFMNVSEMPGWSVLQSYYPQLVEARRESMAKLRSRMLRLSFLMAFVVLAAAAVLGRHVYKVPGFWKMMAVLTASLPLRYLTNYYNQALRAAGKVRIGTLLAAARLLLGIFLLWILVSAFGLWGSILAVALLAAASAVIYASQAASLPHGRNKISD